jgi:hypothetical protein
LCAVRQSAGAANRRAKGGGGALAMQCAACRLPPHLHRQLPGGRQHQDVGGRQTAVAVEQALQQGERKGGGLAGPRDRGAGDVAPRQRQRDARRLDGRGRGVAQRRAGAHQGAGEVEVGEALGRERRARGCRLEQAAAARRGRPAPPLGLRAVPLVAVFALLHLLLLHELLIHGRGGGLGGPRPLGCRAGGLGDDRCGPRCRAPAAALVAGLSLLLPLVAAVVLLPGERAVFGVLASAAVAAAAAVALLAAPDRRRSPERRPARGGLPAVFGHQLLALLLSRADGVALGDLPLDFGVDAGAKLLWGLAQGACGDPTRRRRVRGAPRKRWREDALLLDFFWKHAGARGAW